MARNEMGSRGGRLVVVVGGLRGVGATGPADAAPLEDRLGRPRDASNRDQQAEGGPGQMPADVIEVTASAPNPNQCAPHDAFRGVARKFGEAESYRESRSQ